MNHSDNETLIITEDEAGERLDKILANRYKELRSRSYFQTLIRDHDVLLNGKPAKKQERPSVGDEVEICFVLTPEINVKPENIPLNIIFEDDDLLVINKPPGMVVHPAPGNWTGTFVNALLFHCKSLPSTPSPLRPGIVHRLDKDTSGVLVAAKTSQAHQRLVEMFSGREVYKEYLAVCVGNPGEGEIDLPIGRHPIHRKKMTVREEGRKALTCYQTLATDGSLSLVKLILMTGRTHQIRVHLKHHGTPVLGDATYGSEQTNRKYKVSRQLLHARRIRFHHPVSSKEMEFVAPIPEDMSTFVKKIHPEFSE